MTMSGHETGDTRAPESRVEARLMSSTLSSGDRIPASAIR